MSMQLADDLPAMVALFLTGAVGYVSVKWLAKSSRAASSKSKLAKLQEDEEPTFDEAPDAAEPAPVSPPRREAARRRTKRRTAASRGGQTGVEEPSNDAPVGPQEEGAAPPASSLGEGTDGGSQLQEPQPISDRVAKLLAKKAERKARKAQALLEQAEEEEEEEEEKVAVLEPEKAPSSTPESPGATTAPSSSDTDACTDGAPSRESSQGSLAEEPLPAAEAADLGRETEKHEAEELAPEVPVAEEAEAAMEEEEEEEQQEEVQEEAEEPREEAVEAQEEAAEQDQERKLDWAEVSEEEDAFNREWEEGEYEEDASEASEGYDDEEDDEQLRPRPWERWAPGGAYEEEPRLSWQDWQEEGTAGGWSGRSWKSSWKQSSWKEDEWMTPFDDLLQGSCFNIAPPAMSPANSGVCIWKGPANGGDGPGGEGSEIFTDGQQSYRPLPSSDGRALYTDGVQVYAQVCVMVPGPVPQAAPPAYCAAEEEEEEEDGESDYEAEEQEEEEEGGEEDVALEED